MNTAAASVVPEPLAAIAGGIARLAALDLDGVPAAGLGDGLAAMRRDIDALEAQCCRWLLRFDRTRGFEMEGSNSAVSWLRGVCRLSGGAAAERVQVARQLAQLPDTQASFDAGEIGYQHAAVIARSAAELGVAAMGAAEPALLSAAGRLDPGQLRMLSREMRYRLDPDGALADDNAIFERRRLTISQLGDGAFLLEGLLDAEGGAVVRTALSALDGPPAPDDQRRPEQRRADALVELASRQLRSGDLPSVHGHRPHLVVTVTAGTTAGSRPAAQRATAGHATAGQVAGPVATDTLTLPGAGPVATEHAVATHHGPLSSDTATLHGAGPISIAAMRRLACDASVTTVTVDGGGRPLDVGRSTRSIPAAVRTALVHRDRGCRYPGCDRPPEWTDAHHLRHWADGGVTAIDNLALLCRRHHRLMHERGETAIWADDGALLVARGP